MWLAPKGEAMMPLITMNSYETRERGEGEKKRTRETQERKKKTHTVVRWGWRVGIG